MRQTRICLLLSLVAFAAHGAVLFRKPLHVTRSIDEPLSGKTVVVEQYYFGNRVVTVRGDRTVIADYEKRDITDIDRAAATYSITKFEEAAAPARAAQKSDANVVRARSERRSGREVDVFTADDRAAGLHAEIAVDSSIDLSRDAFDVVIGAAYPDNGGAVADLARGAARSTRVAAASVGANAAAEHYGLPIEEIVRWDAAGETITSSNRITRVAEEVVPAEVMTIPAGARRVESHRAEAKRLMDELDKH